MSSIRSQRFRDSQFYMSFHAAYCHYISFLCRLVFFFINFLIEKKSKKKILAGRTDHILDIIINIKTISGILYEL